MVPAIDVAGLPWNISVRQRSSAVTGDGSAPRWNANVPSCRIRRRPITGSPRPMEQSLISKSSPFFRTASSRLSTSVPANTDSGITGGGVFSKYSRHIAWRSAISDRPCNIASRGVLPAHMPLVPVTRQINSAGSRRMRPSMTE